MELSECADEDAYIDNFIQAWVNHDLFYYYRDESICLDPCIRNGGPVLGTTMERWHK